MAEAWRLRQMPEASQLRLLPKPVAGQRIEALALLSRSAPVERTQPAAAVAATCCPNYHEPTGAWRMVRRRAEAAGIAAPTGCHTFRATGITAYLANGGTLEHAQAMAAHESPRTTKLYDRTHERLTREEVERIRL